jgi:hypothetical protein
MACTVKLLIVANPGIESEAVRDAMVERAAAGPVRSRSSRLHSLAAVRRARLARPPADALSRRGGGRPRRGWNFDEVVVSCRPWLSSSRACACAGRR